MSSLLRSGAPTRFTLHEHAPSTGNFASSRYDPNRLSIKHQWGNLVSVDDGRGVPAAGIDLGD